MKVAAIYCVGNSTQQTRLQQVIKLLILQMFQVHLWYSRTEEYEKLDQILQGCTMPV